jgi:type I restriction enzyme S subunit
VSVALTKLGHQATIIMGQSPPGESYNRDGRGAPLLNGPTEFGPRHPTEKQWTTSPTKLCQTGDVLFCVRGATAGRLNAADKEYCLGRGLAAIRGNPGEFDSGFLRHVLTNGYTKFQARGVGSTFINISSEELANFEVPALPLAEQQRIAEVLDRAEALRAKRRAALAQLDTLTRALFLDLFGDPIHNPNGFPVRPMIDLVDPHRPISYGILMPGPDQDEGVKYVRVVDMKAGGIELSGIRKTSETISNAFRRSLLKPGDLLMSIRGHVGRFAVVPPELDGANITQDTARLAVQGASSIFVRECLRTEGFQRWMVKHTKGVAVRGINLADVKLMPIILPPREEQNSFARRVAAVEKLKTAHRASLAELDALFAALQHRAFRGEL